MASEDFVGCYCSFRCIYKYSIGRPLPAVRTVRTHVPRGVSVPFGRPIASQGRRYECERHAFFDRTRGLVQVRCAARDLLLHQWDA